MLCVCVCMCVSFRALLPAWWWSLQTQIRNGPFDACSRWPVRWASSIRWPCSLERTVPMPRQELSLFLSLITHYSQQNCSVSVEKSVDSKVLIIHSAPLCDNVILARYYMYTSKVCACAYVCVCVLSAARFSSRQRWWHQWVREDISALWLLLLPHRCNTWPPSTACQGLPWPQHQVRKHTNMQTFPDCMGFSFKVFQLFMDIIFVFSPPLKS